MLTEGEEEELGSKWKHDLLFPWPTNATQTGVTLTTCATQP